MGSRGLSPLAGCGAEPHGFHGAFNQCFLKKFKKRYSLPSFSSLTSERHREMQAQTMMIAKGGAAVRETV